MTKNRKYKTAYDLHLFTKEIKALEGKELERYIKALWKFGLIETNDEWDGRYFKSLMKYGKKREIKEILKKLENKKPFLKRNTKDKQEVNKEWSDYFPYIFIHSMGTLVGFFFLLWFSTLYIWFLALLFTVLTGFIHAYVDKKTQVSKDVLVENNPFTIFALCFAAVIYFSAPITDNGAYCAKVYEKSYEREVFGGINQDGSYDISKEFYSRPGRSGCNSTATNGWLLAMSLLLSLVFFIKTLILYGSYILGKKSP